MDQRAIAAGIERILRRAVDDGTLPSAVCAVAVRGQRWPVIAVGDAVRCGEDGAQLPPASRPAAGPDTFYDLASITKILTALTALTLVEAGLLDLDRPLAHWLAEYRSAGRESATLRQLLTHTAGLPPTWGGWRKALEAGMPFDRAALLADLLTVPLTEASGARFEYSCVGYNTVMALAERATGQRWRDLVEAKVLSRLPGGLNFAPAPEECAATELMPELGRGLVRGSVHDEAAWSLGGACGNAGLFGTAAGLLNLGEALRTGLTDFLTPETAAHMWCDQLPNSLSAARTAAGPAFGHGLGLRIGETSWMGSSGRHARGHTGFTGTSLLVDRHAELTVVLLTNRVHPHRAGPDLQLLRRAVAGKVYASLPGATPERPAARWADS
ncbi:beta-lactamase family protein [Paenarthrobacter sp. Z7-10]|uniref:serine hydrolase domain-containing protein n=1 Tax=Paenarthrobacter sp. Z7-10 TaxID=2787635 RepID=UPI0022A99892|nr:serine hydrolase domain-containing protein [Paenarthrobacter sp. Z7-10]MCZ2403019.1 beta-lactamase family protein [Paenarthrobacter sp. Z7-10]